MALAKVLLPLMALALLSTLFLLAREPQGPAEAIPFGRIEAIAREERLGAPRLSGLAPDGTAVTFSADRLAPLPGRPDAFAVEAPRLLARDPGGTEVEAAAGRGEADGRARLLRLSGGVTVEATGGWRLQAPMAEADLGAGTLRAPEGIAGQAPWGRIEAGMLEASRGEAGARLVFKGGVRLLYEPGTPAPAAPSPGGG